MSNSKLVYGTENESKEIGVQKRTLRDTRRGAVEVLEHIRTLGGFTGGHIVDMEQGMIGEASYCPIANVIGGKADIDEERYDGTFNTTELTFKHPRVNDRTLLKRVQAAGYKALPGGIWNENVTIYFGSRSPISRFIHYFDEGYYPDLATSDEEDEKSEGDED